MCGRYTATAAQRVVEGYFGAEFAGGPIPPSFNASPGQHLPVILDTEPGKVQPVLWGIQPKWGNRLLINARSETVTEKPTFRRSFQERRCLVVADGFYEWQKTSEGKQPYRITLADEGVFAFAGIWQDIDGEPAFVIMTTSPNEVMENIHNRMPVILAKSNHEPWLDHAVSDEDAMKLLSPYPAEAMNAYPVSRAVNNSRNQGPELIQPMSDEQAALAPSR